MSLSSNNLLKKSVELCKSNPQIFYTINITNIRQDVTQLKDHNYCFALKSPKINS